MADTPKARPAAETPAPPAAPGVPHFYIATGHLFVHNPESGTAPARAFAPGDHVPAEMVEPNGWQASVRLPEPSPPPRSAPAAVPAETASSKE